MKRFTTLLLLLTLLLSVLASCQGTVPTGSLPQTKETAPLTEGKKTEPKQSTEQKETVPQTQTSRFLTFEEQKALSEEEREAYSFRIFRAIANGVRWFQTGRDTDDGFSVIREKESADGSKTLVLSKEINAAFHDFPIEEYDRKQTDPEEIVLARSFIDAVKAQLNGRDPAVLSVEGSSEETAALRFLKGENGAHIWNRTLVRFHDQGSITEYAVPQDVSVIAPKAFEGNQVLQTVHLNDKLFLSSRSFGADFHSIGSLAFRDCPSLKTLEIPKEVLDPENDSFLVGLHEMLLPVRNSLFSDADIYSYAAETYEERKERVNELFVTQPVDADPDHFFVRDGVLIGYYGLGGHVVIPEGVTEIRGNVFLSARNNLLSVTLPSTLKKICSLAFVGTDHVPGIAIPEGVEVIEAYAFKNDSDGAGSPKWTATYVIDVPKTCKVAENAFSYGWYKE